MKVYRLFRHKKYGEPIEIQPVQVLENGEEDKEENEEVIYKVKKGKGKGKNKKIKGEDLPTVIEEESFNDSEMSVMLPLNIIDPEIYNKIEKDVIFDFVIEMR